MNDASGRQDTLPNGTQLPSSNQVFTSTDHSDEIDLLEYLGALLAYKWLIVAITLFGLLLGVTYALLATPASCFDQRLSALGLLYLLCL